MTHPSHSQRLLYRFYKVADANSFRYVNWLLDGFMYFRAPIDYNDPNEFRVNFRFCKDRDIIKRRYIADHDNCPEGDFEKWFNSVNLNGLHLYLEPLLQRQYLELLGMACFSRKCDDPVMWSHYANNSGIVIAFHMDVLNSFKGMVIWGDVCYQDYIPVVSYFDESDHDVIKKILLHKFASWSYEEEVRIIMPKPNSEYQFPKSLISHVIFHHDTPKAIIDALANSNPKLPIKRATLQYSKYLYEISG